MELRECSTSAADEDAMRVEQRKNRYRQKCMPGLDFHRYNVIEGIEKRGVEL